MQMPGLAGWLAITTALLVTVSILAVAIAGVRLLRDLAEAEALARVELGVSVAREALRQSANDLLIAATVLSERPTLHRLLRDARPVGLDAYIARYCDGASLDACAIVRHGELLASVGSSVEWSIVMLSAGEQGQRFLVTGAIAGEASLGARASMAGQDDVIVYALRRMDAGFAARLSERVGLEIHIVDFETMPSVKSPTTVLDSDALSRGMPVTARLDELGSYAASMPVTAANGETVALLHAFLQQDLVTESVRRLEQRMLSIGIAVAVLATLCGVVIGQYWTAGVRRLTAAARRIGTGDLASSIPQERSAEIGILATTMEEMRRNLVALTQEIRHREAQAQAVLGGIVEGVFAVDMKRRIRFLNAQAEQLLGISAERAFGHFCGSILKPKPDASGQLPCESACPIVAARKDGATSAAEVIGGQGSRGRRIVITSAAASDGIQVQVLRDETELEAVRRTRDTVLANISHEFRTPLSAQLASIELLRDGLGEMTIDAQRELVSSLERGVQRLTWLIDNLLESVRIESGQLTIRRHDLVLEDIVRAARDLIGPLIHQREQVLELQSLGDLPLLRGDRQRLIQVVVNLLANASKFAPPKSTIRIGATTLESDRIEFWVEDEGPGPADPDDGSLFNQFQRSGGEDPEESGLGLGLFIVRSIVERHGGRVSLVRTADARTRARVELPGVKVA